MKTLGSLFLVMMSALIMAQNINYTIESDNPDYSNWMLGLEPFYIDASQINFPVGFGFSGVYTGKPVLLNFSYNRAYFDLNTFSINAPTSLKPHASLEVGAGWAFVRKNKSKDLKVTLSESSDGTYTYTKFIMVPGTVKRVTALRGGLWRYRNSYKSDKRDDYQLDTVNMVADVLSYDPGVNQWEPFVANVTVTSLYAGISISGTSNLKISSKDFYGIKTHTLSSHFYVDALFAPFINLGEYEHENDPTDTYDLLASDDYDLNDAFTKSRMGFRIGWQVNKGFNSAGRSLLGFYSRMEAGSRPGIKGGNWYMLLTVGIGINGRV